VKNALVAAAPAAAGRILEPRVLSATILTFIAFTLAASSIYLINDIYDRKQDRLHPVKRFRPIASGALTVPMATIAAAVTSLAAIALAYALNLGTLAIVLAYIAISLSYSIRLKHEPVLDIAVVAAGFVLRAIAGGVASHIFISHWFLLVTGFASLFIVSGKRYSELIRSPDTASKTRKALAHYTTGFLNFVRALSATATVVTYCLWTFERAQTLRTGAIWIELSIVPLTLGILRYALLIENGDAESPELVLASDIFTIAIGGIWSILMVVGLFVI
jgi:decaprenyl-phosphate phosphoribosyltransferase